MLVGTVYFILYGAIVYLVVRFAYEHWLRIRNDNYDYALRAERERIETERLRLESQVVTLPNDAILYNGKVLWDTATGERAGNTNMVRVFYDEVQAQMRHLEQVVQGMQAKLPAGQVEQLLGNTVNPTSHIPAYVAASDLFARSKPTMASIPLGVTVDQHGQEHIVTQPIEDMMHTLIIGRTKRGKSTGMLAFLAALVCTSAKFFVLGIDISGSKLNMLQLWNRMLYPVAVKPTEAKAMLLSVVGDEVNRRQALYREVPEADSLKTYNEYRHKDTPELVHWFIIIDEGTILLQNKAIANILTKVILGTRQYGIYAIITGHAAKASVFDTVLRPSCPTRIVYDTEEAGMKIALEVTKLPRPLPHIRGRAFARLCDGYDGVVEMQSPDITPSDFRKYVLEHDQAGGPVNAALPTIVGRQGHLDLIAKMSANGDTHTAMERAVRDKPGGAAYYYVETLLEELASAV